MLIWNFFIMFVLQNITAQSYKHFEASYSYSILKKNVDSGRVTAVLRYLLCKKNEPELSLHFLVTSYDGQGHVYKRKIICGADLEKTYI